jgi:hypothetical protein
LRVDTDCESVRKNRVDMLALLAEVEPQLGLAPLRDTTEKGLCVDYPSLAK